MNDGFTDPDPADTDAGGENGLIVEDGDIPFLDVSASCEDCVHYDVCAAFGQFDMMWSQWKGATEEPPFDQPEDLALICNEYETGEKDDDDE